MMFLITLCSIGLIIINLMPFHPAPPTIIIVAFSHNHNRLSQSYMVHHPTVCSHTYASLLILFLPFCVMYIDYSVVCEITSLFENENTYNNYYTLFLLTLFQVHVNFHLVY